MTLPDSEPPPFDAHDLTWQALLGHWMEFAKSALALPKDAAGQRLRDSVPDIIALQAVWFALGTLDHLRPEERGLALDRSAVLIDRHAAALRRRWADEALPEQLRDLVDDARDQLAAAQAAYGASDEPQPPTERDESGPADGE